MASRRDSSQDPVANNEGPGGEGDGANEEVGEVFADDVSISNVVHALDRESFARLQVGGGCCACVLHICICICIC